MKKIKNQIINLILLSLVFPNIDLSQQSVEVNILEENTNSMIVEYKINTFDIDALDISGELFHQITEAYNVLTDNETRTAYDASLLGLGQMFHNFKRNA